MANKENNHIILKLKELNIGYKKPKKTTIVASNINCLIPKGKLIALIGKNGIGKTTLLRTLCGIQKPISGTILLKNKNINHYSNTALAKKISLVLTSKLPESELSVFELVALGRQPYTNWLDQLTEFDIQKIEHALTLTETLHLKERPFTQLSDGQLQRVLISRALAQDSEIIILDEPSAHLDIYHTFKIFSLLKKLVTTTQKTILISTHQINLALEIADNFILLKDKNVTIGSKKELIQKKAFKNLFNDNLIYFDDNSEQFRISQS